MVTSKVLFGSLSGQIGTGIKSDYKEVAIVKAIDRVASISLKPRWYISFFHLKQVLWVHFKETFWTELY